MCWNTKLQYYDIINFLMRIAMPLLSRKANCEVLAALNFKCMCSFNQIDEVLLTFLGACLLSRTGRDETIPEIVAVLFYGTGRISDTPWDLLMELHAMKSAITVAYVPASYLVVTL